MAEIRTRIAPAPTGPLHLGTARTALFNYLFTQKAGGKFLLRLEDTDVVRSKPEFENDIYDGLKWLGLDWDEGPDVGGEYAPYRQSQRGDIYKRYLDKLLEKGLAYPCFCTADELDTERKRQMAQKLPPRYSGKCSNLSLPEQEKLKSEGRKYTIRFRMPKKLFRFKDLIRGDVEFSGEEIADFIIVKADGTYIFLLSNIVDDIEMKISDVIRGEDHLSNTPKQIALAEALGVEPPRYAHIPLILNPDRSKMSKRKGEVRLTAFRDQGYLPEAMVNFLAFLGWSPGTEEEVFTMDELVERFSLEAVGKAGAIFNVDKLNWINGYYLRQLSQDELSERLLPYLPGVDKSYFRKIVPLIQERLKRLGDVVEYTRFFFAESLEYDTKLVVGKKHSAEQSKAALEKVLGRVEEIPEFSKKDLENALRKLLEELGWKTGELFMIIRVAITGSTATPPLFETMEALGKERCVTRLHAAIKKLESLL